MSGSSAAPVAKPVSAAPVVTQPTILNNSALLAGATDAQLLAAKGIAPAPAPDPAAPLGPRPPVTPAPPPATGPGLINANPEITSYNPAASTASTVNQVSSASPTAFTVTPNQTVSGQISNIIASGSPLMAQAEANANMQMNQRGLINSSEAITAGQNALYSAATPIATADANTYATAATNTAEAQNAAETARAAAQNTAYETNAQLQTQNNQFNTGQTNTAFSAAASASNALLQATTTQQMQDATTQAVAQLQSTTDLATNAASNASSQIIANIQANTSLSVQQQQDATSQAIAGLNNATQTYLGNLSSATNLTLQQQSAAATASLAVVNNASAQAIAGVQANTQLTVSQQQTQSAQIIANLNNQNAVTVANINNAAALQNIATNGAINTQIQNLTDNNKTLLQTSGAAAQIYTQTLTNMSSIITNPNLNTAQQTTALNNQVAALNDALQAIQGIAGNTQVSSLLDFSSPGTTPAVAPSPAGAPSGGTAAAAPGAVPTVPGATFYPGSPGQPTNPYAGGTG